jgi:hypothetical protein
MTLKATTNVLEVIHMPFDSSYVDHDRQRYTDSQDYLVGLAKRIVRDPVSTHVIKTTTSTGKIRFLVVDKSKIPGEGSLVIVATSQGFKVGRIKRAVPRKYIWGTIVWILRQEG